MGRSDVEEVTFYSYVCGLRWVQTTIHVYSVGYICSRSQKHAVWGTVQEYLIIDNDDTDQIHLSDGTGSVVGGGSLSYHGPRLIDDLRFNHMSVTWIEGLLGLPPRVKKGLLRDGTESRPRRYSLCRRSRFRRECGRT